MICEEEEHEESVRYLELVESMDAQALEGAWVTCTSNLVPMLERKRDAMEAISTGDLVSSSEQLKAETDAFDSKWAINTGKSGVFECAAAG